jgi:D-arabinose 1-dehydrogenase-like Zn-dependent alcohol dehydrogenase
MLPTPVDYRPYECWTFGSECDGGFAQFTVAPSQETHAVHCDWSDEELAAVPCAGDGAGGAVMARQPHHLLACDPTPE